MTQLNQVSAADGEIVTVVGTTTGVRGRYLIDADANHFVSDAKVSTGGPGEAVQAGQLLLSALASCALAVIQRHADTLGVRLESGRVNVSFKRDPSDVTRYEYIRLRVRLNGVDSRTSAALVKEFTDTCPIYNTLARGGNIGVELEDIAIAA
ncbi:MAG: OsmC family protein [Xanthobacteraceae bacterium]|nr:OsmC family protein [Xanthobacteraceae bacterium]